MKRDWDLIREILIAVESIQTHGDSVSGSTLPGRDSVEVSYHIHILDQAGLVRATCFNSLNSPRQCKAFEMTWEGHEFLDQIRSKTLWSKTMNVIQVKGLDLSFSTIKAAAAAIAKSLISL
ncbi:DUF2513 domain-containing protein [Pseudomonas cichorii]|uniref:DUF2513 domain-containing protein n=1 Tax=Pseudomonas cichorii TaxID=36746 RepID=UPI001C8AE86A|nr:DUF2513 domain-containing protein [Pseudomonas cichorii]MBX8528565.1 DUF2513 domain-containing protein [Pseudomonas cichorii]